PLKLETGTLMTTAEAGAIEYDGTSLYYTDSGNSRKTLATAVAGGYLPLSGGTMTGAEITAAGTQALPSLGIGSTNNGLYYPAANQIGISTNGAEKIRIDNN